MPDRENVDRALDLARNSGGEVTPVVKLFAQVTLEDKGALYHDRNGSGTLEGVKIASFKPATSLTWSDLLLF